MKLTAYENLFLVNQGYDQVARSLKALAKYPALRPDEIAPVLAQLEPIWKRLFATALYTGMRKGELLGLRKEDVDLSARLITIRRSHTRDTTKAGHADAVPIAAELVPFVEAAIAASPSNLVFPRSDGRMM